MIELKNELMSKHITFKVGGPVEIMLIPETEDELIQAIKFVHQKETPCRILGNGSNLIVKDKGLKGYVIKNTKACLALEVEDNIVYTGASVKLQQYIKFCTKNNLEGPEYLFSVPATMGGAIFMNAGRGKQFNLQISDYLTSVKIFDGHEIRVLSKEACKFEYRSSIFHEHRDWVILGAYFQLNDQNHEVGDRKIQERKSFVKEHQDYNAPTAGSVFKAGHHRAFNFVKGFRIGKAGYSKKTLNWINNLGGAKSRDIILLIICFKVLSYILFKKTKLENEIWG